MRNRLLVAIAFIVLFLNGCSAKAQNTRPLTEQERLKLAADYSRDHRGLSVLVMKGDRIVFEDYANNATADTPWTLFSGTKSFSGAMLCAAIEDKLISGFDERVSDTITEWKTDKQKSQITIRQLLSLTSGISAGAANQRLYIIRSLDMVIVRQGRASQWDDREFLGRLLLGKI